MNVNFFRMKKTVNTIASAVVMFALLVSALATPATTVTAFTSTDFNSEFEFDAPEYSGDDFEFSDYEGNGESSATDGEGEYTYSDTGSSEASSESSGFVRCAIDAVRRSITEGETTTLVWETENAETIYVNGEEVTDLSGSFETSPLFTDTTFELEVYDGNGSKCLAEVVVNCDPPETPKLCELDIEKTVNTAHSAPGQELTYTIEVKNIGDADCTGTGVRIEDVVDPNLTYLRHELTNNLSAGYENTPVYTSADRTLRFNGHELTPGESGTITWVAEVDEPSSCGDFAVTNQAKVTAKELDNFHTWVYSQTVKTEIANECGEPKVPECTLTPSVQTVQYGETATLSWTTSFASDVTLSDFGSVSLSDSDDTIPLFTNTEYTLTAVGEGGTVTCDAVVKVEREQPVVPSCPLSSAEGRTIIDFTNGKLRTDKGADRAETAIQEGGISAGKYDVTLVSWDGYNTRTNASQPHEQWQLQFIADDAVLASSGVIGDLEDKVREAIRTETVNTDFVLTSDADGVRAVQPFYPDTSSPNSLYPICAALDEQEVESAEVVAHKIVCTDESQLPNYGTGGPNITANTAAEWVAENESCELVEGWQFQWTDNQSDDPGDTFVGVAGNPWNTFGPTDSNGRAAVEINLDELNNDRVWFREVLKDGYIPFKIGRAHV